MILSGKQQGGERMSGNKLVQPRFSDTIGAFLKLMDDVQKDYTYNSEQVDRMNRLTQDYLHSLELDGLDYKGRAKIATQLTKTRQARRDHKDMVEVLEPIVLFLDSEKGKQLINLMREVLGKTRKVENYLAHRKYIPRELTKEEG